MKHCLCCAALFQEVDWHCQSCGYSPKQNDCFPYFAPELALNGLHFLPEAFEDLFALEADNFWFSARNQIIISAIHRQLPQMNRYLEIGCGTGYVLAAIVHGYP